MAVIIIVISAQKKKNSTEILRYDSFTNKPLLRG